VTAESRNAAVVAELHALAAQGVIDAGQLARLAERYPVGRWDWMRLVRAFTLFGALGMAAGLAVLAPRLVDVKNLLDGGLAVVTIALLAGGHRLARAHSLPRAGAALQLCGGLSLQALTVTLAAHYSTGSKNWPALVGVDALLAFALAYLLSNRLLLIQACANACVFFGAETGYVSGWGVYWMSMNYPARFLLAGAVALGVGWAHARFLTGAWQSFSRVYAHFGLLISHLALWFLALFGWFENRVEWRGNEGQRLAFSVGWAAISFACLLAGSRLNQRVLRGYGLTFLLIDLYTAYFQFIAYKSAPLWFFHLLLVGGSLLALGYLLEHKRSRANLATEAK
jgi:hypothetical protein